MKLDVRSSSAAEHASAYSRSGFEQIPPPSEPARFEQVLAIRIRSSKEKWKWIGREKKEKERGGYREEAG